ncbi:MAG: cupin domain-containing protein [Leptolyngbyaceae cyanobacterium MO_188.B28]|nr:cupin domain-containing protein [Leptolyngbyaceae cyanobacterium MO_188.B28]
MTPAERPVNSNPTDEIAALYALDLLDADDQIKADQTLAQDAMFAQQVREFHDAAAALPYSAPLVAMASDLKARLFERIAQEPEASDSPLLELLKRSVEDLKQQAAALAWEPMPGSDDAEIAPWRTDEAHREVAFFIRKPKGGLFPNHAHAGGETVLVLDGDFVADGQVYGAGDRVVSLANTTHRPGTQQGCIALCIACMDDEILS